jgi:hypothetical protein
VGTAREHLAVFPYSNFNSVEWSAYRAGFFASERIQANNRGRLGKPITLQNKEAYGAEEIFHRGIQPRAPAHNVLQTAELLANFGEDEALGKGMKQPGAPASGRGHCGAPGAGHASLKEGSK